LALGLRRQAHQLALSHRSRATCYGLFALTLGDVIVWMRGASMEPATVDFQGGSERVELWYGIGAQVKPLFPLPGYTGVVDVRGHERRSGDVVGNSLTHLL
jgi:hypothetical protein